MKHINNPNNNIDYVGKKNKYGTEIIRKKYKNDKMQWVWECKCGFCGKIFEELPTIVLNGHRKSCGCLKIKNAEKRNTKIKYSFKDWCLENNKCEYLKFWDYELNDKNPDEVSYGSTIKRWFKCCNGDCGHKSELHSLSHITNRGDSLYCTTCNSFAFWGIKKYGNDFLEKYWDYEKNKDINPWIISAASGKKVWLKCVNNKEHKSYYITCGHFYTDGRCPYCSNELKSSNLQDKVSKYIVNKYSNFILLHESNCTIKPINPKTNRPLLFDNEIKDLKLIIEVHGKQHYEITNITKMIAKKYNTSPDKQLEYQKWKDKYKKDEAINNGYFYLEIPYFTERTEKYKVLIDEKIADILNNN